MDRTECKIAPLRCLPLRSQQLGFGILIRAEWQTKTSEPQSPRSQQLHEPKLKRECATCTSEVTVPELPVALQQLCKHWPGRPMPGHTLLPALLGTP